MKIELILKPCPWCNETPTIWMPISQDTWLWKVECDNNKCLMRPKSPHVAFRNTSKTDFLRFVDKIHLMAEMWNIRNPRLARDKKVIDVSALEKNFTANFNDVFPGPYYIIATKL